MPAQDRLRVGLVGTWTLDQYADCLRVAGVARGMDLDIRTAGFGQVEQAVLDPGGALYAHAPDVVVLAPHAGGTSIPLWSDEPTQVVDHEVARWTGLWSVIADRLGADVLQHTLAVPPERPLGNLSGSVENCRSTMLRRCNDQLAAAAGGHVSLVDVEALAADVGARSWFDARYWHMAKQAVALGHLPELAQQTAAVLAARRGGTRKCLVLDLDGTLWGGVVGEVGPEGVELEGSAVGEAHLAFQEYVLALRQRGILLAVCSKNDADTAREVFENRRDMLVSLDDITVFVANWEPKSANIERIADRLDIGLDAMVFVDDNPAECEIVRQHLPEVDVIDLPQDSAHYVRALSDYLGFETAELTDEDRRKAETYRAREEAVRLKGATASLDEYLESLEMVATVEPVVERNMARVVQLLNKTNQWNLTTRRRDTSELRAFLDRPGTASLTLRLRDRFGDHGLVSVALLARNGDALEIDSWLMSCRVMGRSVEHVMLAQMLDVARDAGARRLRGSYVPTRKNGPVAQLFEQLGFTLERDDGGTTSWLLKVADDLVHASGPVEVEQLTHV